MRKKTKKVIIAISGGIDSSVAAALLKRDGFDVVGVFMKLWPSFDEKRAKRVAKKLGIPFYVFNFEKEFKKRIVDYFLKEYKKGRTPNPCVVCNKEIKFGILLNKALSLEADYVATGHYVRRKGNKLLKGKDKEKDQSYFLWQLDQKILGKILFPIGDYTKTEVRELAKKFKLPVLDIPESQEICFIQTTTVDFLKKHLKLEPGKIIDNKGKVIGQHRGLWFYTIGQRKGIELPKGPFYVLDKDLKKNVLIITKNKKDLYKKELIAKNVNWVSDKEPKMPLKVKARIRYRHSEVSATIKKQKNGRIKVVFSRGQRAVTPGQSVVFYKGQELLGGGIISNYPQTKSVLRA
ncbi:tRNA 2-thiouridine(34) synthase MnmA [Patescibacteria group bacterium]|nr:tRNA 2-thiouridine(34) synthase MnmA [Patescibacteria group bacterium]